MRVQDFNSVPSKKNARAERKRALPVLSATVEVFVCVPMNGLRLTRAACTKIAADPPTIGPCARCAVGASHVRGRIPGAWPDGKLLKLLSIHVPGTAT